MAPPSKITFFFMIVFLKQWAQTITPENYHSNDKTGYFRTYLDEKGIPTDSADSFFWGYEYYENGAKTFTAFISEKNFVRYRIVFEGTPSSKGKPIPINGVIKWYKIQRDGKEKRYIENDYKDGYPIKYRQYSTLCDIPFLVVDFEKRYNGISGTFFLENRYRRINFGCRSKAKYYWFRKGKNKWESFRIKQ